MVNLGPFGMGCEVAPGLAPYDELFILKTLPKTIKEGDNTKEDQ